MTIEKKKISKFALFLIAISFLMLSGILIYNHYQKQNQVDISSTELNQKEKVVDEKLKNYVCKYLEDSNQNADKFSLQKAQKIKNTDLYKMINLMPKGANLHLHYLANLSAEGTFDFCYDNPNIYIIPEKSGDFEDCQLYVSDNSLKVPKGFILFKDAIDKNILSKEQILNSWVMDSYTGDKQGVWTEFHRKFKRVKSLGTSEITYKDFYKASFLENIKDNVQHLELRINLNLLNLEDDKENYGAKGIELIRQAFYEVKKEYPDFTLKIILAQSKNKSGNIEFEDFMKITNNLKSKIKDTYDPQHTSDFIVGYDLVGEDKAGGIDIYIDKIKALKNEGINLTPYFHAGETDDINNDSIVKAYELGTKRVGHGTNLGDFPELLEKFKTDEICLEVCPISNQILKLIPDIKTHPAYKYFREGVPIVLAPDDPFMFGSGGVSFDFFEAIVSWNLSLSDIKQLITNSIKYSALSTYEKEKAMETWKSKWEEFVNSYNV